MHLSPRQKRIGLLAVTLAVVLLTAWQFCWFDREPRYNGRTVTQWLDSLVLFHHEQRTNGTWEILRSPDDIARDPALQALLAIGDRGVPVLMQRLTEPALFPPGTTRSERWSTWWRWKKYRLRGQSRAAYPGSGQWPEFQKMRKAAAAFTLLALGTNAHGGFTSLMESYAAAPKHTTIYGGKVTGAPHGFTPSLAVQLAVSALPHRRDEIRADVARGLQHTNRECQLVAEPCARVFPELSLLTK